MLTVDNFAFHFNYTPVGRTSDSIAGRLKEDGRSLMLWLLSGPLVFNCWIFLLWYSVLFTVESLSLLYFIFIS